jgi:energy-coupling factor transport system permease protein
MAFELTRNIAIGQYIPTHSVIHRLDPRTKILSTLFLMVAVSVIDSLLAMALLLLLLIGITWLAKLPFGYILRGFLRSLPVLAFFLLLALLYLGWQEPAGKVYWEWWYLRVTRLALQLMGLSLLRLLCFLFLVSLPSLTTSVTELTHGIRILLSPFRRFGVPAHDIALVFMIALRFVPTLAEEMERVMKAQSSRGGEIGNLDWRRPVQIGRALLPLIVPLFVNAFRRAEELAVAMEARCFMPGADRTSYTVLQGDAVDIFATLLILAICLVAWLAPWPALHQLSPLL